MRRRHHLLCLCLGTLWVTSAVAGPSREQQAACTRLESRVAEVRLRLRLGYNARQGRLYRQKLTALEAEQRTVCR